MEEISLSPKELLEIKKILAENPGLLEPIEVLRSRHHKLMDMIAAYSENPSTTSILELGCSDGYFVEWLRQKGYKAEGVDLKIQNSAVPYLHHGDIAYLDDVLDERTFDFIVATGLFNIGTQVYHLFGKELNMDKLGKVSISPEHKKAALANIEKILKTTFKHLNPQGFFMTIDNIMPGDYTAFTPETAINIGYKVVRHTGQEAVLQKPLNK